MLVAANLCNFEPFLHMYSILGSLDVMQASRKPSLAPAKDQVFWNTRHLSCVHPDLRRRPCPFGSRQICSVMISTVYFCNVFCWQLLCTRTVTLWICTGLYVYFVLASSLCMSTTTSIRNSSVPLRRCRPCQSCPSLDHRLW